jgi:DnaJ-class molecular chaperone
MEKNYYQILGVSEEAPEKEIKRVYHNLARKLHPDKATSPEEAERFEREFALVSKAYNILKDPAKRAEYDKSLNLDKKRQVLQAEKPKAASKLSKVVTSERANIAQKAYAKGLQLYNMEEYGRAIDFFEAAINNDDTEPTYHVKLALALMRSRKSFTRAVEACRKAVELDPYNIDYKLNLAEEAFHLLNMCMRKCSNGMPAMIRRRGSLPRLVEKRKAKDY